MERPNIPVQIEFPTLKKMIKINMNPRSSLKQYMVLFSAKFDTDFSIYRFSAFIKKTKMPISIEVPVAIALEGTSL